MDKQQILEELKTALASGAISQSEVLETMKQETFVQPDSSAKKMDLSQIMYYIGGGIVFVGICILIFQNWEHLPTFAKIGVTLGFSFLALVAAMLFNKYEKFKGIAQAFFLLTFLVMPLGFYITIDKMGIDIGSVGVSVLVWFVLTLVFSSLFYYYRSTSLLLYVILFATGFFHFMINWMVGANLPQTETVVEYRFLVTGLAYILLGLYLSKTTHSTLTGFLYGFGCLGFLGASMALGGWSPNQNIFWELIYPVLVFGIIFSSVYLKAKSFLVLGTIFLIGYIFKLTSEYFQQSMGWPLALVVAGFLVMLIGYYAVKINKKYLTTIKLK